MIDTILFDLDGTLLPMDQEHFMEVYFGELARTCAKFGFAPKPLTEAVWAGTKAMVQNDGNITCEQRFWDTFAGIMGEEVLALKPELERFYEEEFHNAKVATGENPLAADLIRLLREKGYTLVLASNPLFPHRAYRTRLGWIGLAPENFDHITCYERAHYCKPNPAYYREILADIQKQPKQCMMIGNDVKEDGCAADCGIDVYLVTDCLIPDEAQASIPFSSGSFRQLHEMLASRPPLV